MHLPVRKPIRLKNFDYSSSGIYFLTFCTEGRQCILSEVTAGEIVLKPIGMIVDHWWKQLPNHFLNLTLDDVVVMPNHVHAILKLESQARVPSEESTHFDGRASIGQVLAYWKYQTSKEIRHRGLSNTSICQTRFFDRVIRNDEELRKARQYIADNPANWDGDKMNPAFA